MINLEFKMTKRLQNRIAAQYGHYDVAVGILEDSPHHRPLSKSRGLATVAGGPARKRSKRISGTVAQVGEIIRKVHKVAYLRAPIRNDRSKDMQAFRKAFVTFLSGKAKSRSQSETALRAVIRNPILARAYGNNTRRWARIKGFNRKLIDTGQFFRSIIARVRTKQDV